MYMGVLSMATATGAATPSWVYGTIPVRTTAKSTYSTVQMASEPMMPTGMSFCGFLASCAAVETASKPI